MKIAIIGTGIAGNYAAYRLAPHHDITVFESKDRIGGHTNTLTVREPGRKLAIDTGFIVFNDATYPNFIALLDELGVASQPSDMSFSVSSAGGGIEYNGSSLNRLFAQRSNLLKPSFYRMLTDALRSMCLRPYRDGACWRVRTTSPPGPIRVDPAAGVVTRDPWPEALEPAPPRYVLTPPVRAHLEGPVTVEITDPFHDPGRLAAALLGAA